MLSGSFVALTDGQVNSRRDRLTGFLDKWGDLTVRDIGREMDIRLLEFALECPGVALPVELKVRYREYYRRGRDRHWNIHKYHYEYLDVPRTKRFAYHLHDIGSRKLVPHAHCETADALTTATSEDSPHRFRAVELDLREAHEDLMQLWASDREPDCAALRPLEIARDL